MDEREYHLVALEGERRGLSYIHISKYKNVIQPTWLLTVACVCLVLKPTTKHLAPSQLVIGATGSFTTEKQ